MSALAHSFDRRSGRIAFFGALCMLLTSPSPTLARNRDVTAAEAGELVRQALSPTQRTLRGLRFDTYPDPKVPGFYEFEVTWDHPGEGSAVVGHFGVHKPTGTVWELVLCRKMESRDLRSLQVRIRNRIRLGSQELRTLGDKAPCAPIDPALLTR